VALNPKTMPKWVESHISTNDLSSTGQFLGVKLSGDRTIVLVSSDTDICYGILQNDPGAGEQAAVMKEGKCPIITAETLAAGNIVRIDSNGKAALHAGGGLVFAPSVRPQARLPKLNSTAQCL